MKLSTKLLIGFTLLLCQIEVFAQSPEIILPESYNGLKWETFRLMLESDHPVRFFYNPDSIPEIIISFSAPFNQLDQVLENNFSKINITVTADGNGNYFLTKGAKMNTRLPDDFFNISSQFPTDTVGSAGQNSVLNDFLRTSSEFVSKAFTVGTKDAGIYAKKVIVSGKIFCFNEDIPLPGATIYIDEIEAGTIANQEGYYSISLHKGKYTFKLRNIGYQETSFKVEVLSTGTLDLYLPKKVFMMETVEIRSDVEHNVKSVQMGFERIAVKDIKEIPTVMGERDIIKVALLLPGVQSVGEGSSGFNVRGSPTDQNIFYISDVPVYNTSHLFGFFSAFNSDAVSEFKLYKSSIPAKYGGRLSSIFDIKPWQIGRAHV